MRADCGQFVIQISRVRVCACVCARVCVRVCVRMMRVRAGVRVFYARVRVSCAVPSLPHPAHLTISNAYGSEGLQIARPVVMMASADEGGAGGLGRRQNLDNPISHASPPGTVRDAIR